MLPPFCLVPDQAPSQIDPPQVDAATPRLSKKKLGSTYIKVLQAGGIRPGMGVLDFGCSRRYGGWQLRQAGYKVLSYEISSPRARCAQSMLGCTLVEPAKLDSTIDCFFSAHLLGTLRSPSRSVEDGTSNSEARWCRRHIRA